MHPCASSTTHLLSFYLLRHAPLVAGPSLWGKQIWRQQEPITKDAY